MVVDVAWQEAVTMFQEVSQEQLGSDCLHTLATGCVNAGDLLMVPGAYVVVQKAVNSDTIGLRFSSHLLCHDAVGGSGLVVIDK